MLVCHPDKKLLQFKFSILKHTFDTILICEAMTKFIGSSGSEMGRTYSLHGEMRNSNKIVVIKLKEKAVGTCKLY
jgi:hypothetical protein